MSINDELEYVNIAKDDFDAKKISMDNVIKVFNKIFTDFSVDVNKRINKLNDLLNTGDDAVNQYIYNTYFDFYGKKLYVDYQDNSCYPEPYYDHILVFNSSGKTKINNIQDFLYSNEQKEQINLELIELYNDYMSLYDLYDFAMKKPPIKSTNSDFKISIDEEVISINKNITSKYNKTEEELITKCNTNTYAIDTYYQADLLEASVNNRFNLIDGIKQDNNTSNETILNNIYVNINDLPKCLKKVLTSIRKDELVGREDNKIEKIFRKIYKKEEK